MTRERLADAYEEQAALFGRLAEVTAQIAHELRGMPQPGAGGASPAAPSPSLTGSPAPVDTVWVKEADIPALKPQVDAGLGVCPTHGVHWTVKSGGISKNGKPYKSFWKCAEKDGDTFCNEKPQRIWADTHPIREGVAA